MIHYVCPSVSMTEIWFSKLLFKIEDWNFLSTFPSIWRMIYYKTSMVFGLLFRRFFGYFHIFQQIGENVIFSAPFKIEDWNFLSTSIKGFFLTAWERTIFILEIAVTKTQKKSITELYIIIRETHIFFPGK